MIVSRKGRGRVNNGGGYNNFSTRHRDAKFDGGSRFEVLEKDNDEDIIFAHPRGYNGPITKKDQPTFHFKTKTKKNPKKPTTTNSHTNANSPAMQSLNDKKAKHPCLKENLVVSPTHMHIETMSVSQPKIHVTLTNPPIPPLFPLAWTQ